MALLTTHWTPFVTHMNENTPHGLGETSHHYPSTFSSSLLNGGSAYGLYDVNQILLTSDPMPAALLSDLKIRIPLS